MECESCRYLDASMAQSKVALELSDDARRRIQKAIDAVEECKAITSRALDDEAKAQAIADARGRRIEDLEMALRIANERLAMADTFDIGDQSNGATIHIDRTMSGRLYVHRSGFFCGIDGREFWNPSTASWDAAQFPVDTLDEAFAAAEQAAKHL